MNKEEEEDIIKVIKILKELQQSDDYEIAHEFVITKDQILNLEDICTRGRNYSGSSELKNMFPLAFVEDKKELQIDFTGWMKNNIKSNKKWLMYFEQGILKYGFDSNGDWFFYNGTSCIKDHYYKAKTEEVIEALTKKAVKSYKVGDYIKFLNGINTNLKRFSFWYDDGILLLSDDEYRLEIFKDGIWAEIIPTITIKEAESKLNDKFKILKNGS